MATKSDYKSFQLVGDCGEFTLTYCGVEPHCRPQTVRLEAEDESNAIFEAASLLELPESDLEVEWM